MSRVTLLRWIKAVSLTVALSLVALLPGARASASHVRSPHIVLTFDIDSDSVEFTNSTQIVKAYEKLHPDITIKMQPVAGDDAQKEFVKAAAGTLPEIMYSADVFTLPFGYRHIIQNMEPLIHPGPISRVRSST
jgi:ABC-type glycerol-3-phosphate transport system substrate-binding protein